MPITSQQRLLRNIFQKDWTSANRTFAGIMEQKVADRLQRQKQRIAEGILREDAGLNEATEMCTMCDGEGDAPYTADNMSGSCRTCGGSGKIYDKNDDNPPKPKDTSKFTNAPRLK